MQTVIYARYSSLLQNSRSIDDQIAVCRDRCEAEGWPVAEVFTDYAIGGGAGVDENQRPGMAALLARVEAGGIDQVLADSTSRIARNQGDAHHIRERINFAGARLFTLSDGEVDAFRGAIKGLLDEQQRKDLAHNIRRAQRGRAELGRAPAGIAYGYRTANRLDDRGQLQRGLREVDPDQAEVVRRIFTAYAAGQSARQIADDLNREGVKPPSGTFWRANTINGGEARGDGILRNRLYRGELVIGRTRKVVDPRTRKVRIKPNPPSSWIVQPVPHLRIIDEDLWQRVEQQRARVALVPMQKAVRPKRLLSGLLRCGVCGGSYTIVRGDRWGCASRREGGSAVCSNGRTISTTDLERRVVNGLESKMLDPDAVALYVAEYHRNYARVMREIEQRGNNLRRELAEATARVDRLVAAIAQGGSDFPAIREALAAASIDKERLASAIASAAATSPVALHPNLAGEYRRRMADLATALAHPEGLKQAAPRLRSLIDNITLTPSQDRTGIDIEVTGKLANMIALASGQPAKPNTGAQQVERVRGIELQRALITARA